MNSAKKKIVSILEVGMQGLNFLICQCAGFFFLADPGCFLGGVQGSASGDFTRGNCCQWADSGL